MPQRARRAAAIKHPAAAVAPTCTQRTRMHTYAHAATINTRHGNRNGQPIGPQAGSSWLRVYPEGLYQITQYATRRYGRVEIRITGERGGGGRLCIWGRGGEREGDDAGGGGGWRKRGREGLWL